MYVYLLEFHEFEFQRALNTEMNKLHFIIAYIVYCKAL